MKKILYIVSTLKRSGPTSQLYNLIKYLDSNRFEPYLITLSSEPADSRWADYEALGVKLYTLGLSRISGVILAAGRVKKLVEHIQPDLIHTQGIRSDVLSSRLLAAVPRIATIRNFPQHDYAMRYGGIQGKLMLWRHTNSMRKLDLCVGVSSAVTKNLSYKFGVMNTHSILNGVDTDCYSPPSDAQKTSLKKKLGLNINAEIWISSGHLSAIKDPVLLINSWLNTFGDDKSKCLVIIGDGPMREECEKIINSSSNVFLLGRVSNVADYLKASDFFVSTSKSEGMPNAVLEAMACGLPVLISNIEPHLEIWKMEPSIGSLFDLGNMHCLQSRLELLQQEDKFAMSRSAIKLIDDKLSAQVMSQQYQKTYIDIMKDT